MSGKESSLFSCFLLYFCIDFFAVVLLASFFLRMSHQADSGDDGAFLRFDQADTLCRSAHRRNFLEMDTDDDAIVGHDQTIFIAVDGFQGDEVAVLLIDVDGLDTLGTSRGETVFFNRCLFAITVLGDDQDLGTFRIGTHTDDFGAVDIHALDTGRISAHRTNTAFIETDSLAVGSTDNDL